MLNLEETLAYVVRNEGSDLHLKVPSKPIARIHGRLRLLDQYDTVTPEDTERVLREMLNEKKIAEFEESNEIDFAYELPAVARFRCNAFRQRGWISVAARVIPHSVRTIRELGLPSVIGALAEEERGLVLLTGTTGSGKSTTLAAIVDHINESKARHIVTIEDPIEYLHTDRASIINQREVGMDTESFGRAMRRVLRQDPDVILVGEMRDEETVRTALGAAETGHLVLSTVHTLDAAESINRILDFFPLHEQKQARAMLAGTLKGIVSQRLVVTSDGSGRVAVCEVLRMTGRARDMILDPEETGRLRDVIAEGEYYGMQTFDQALLRHYQAGRVSMEDAMRAASSPHDFKLLVAADGQTATTMRDLDGLERPPEEPESPGPEPTDSEHAAARDSEQMRPNAADPAPPSAADPAPPSAPDPAPPSAPDPAPPRTRERTPPRVPQRRPVSPISGNGQSTPPPGMGP